jgi:hypothetical protein
MSEQRLAALEVQVARAVTLLEALSSRVDERLDEQEDFRRSLRRTMFGNGDGVGVLTRVDRLEQSAKRGKWVARTAVGACIAMVVSALWGLLTRRQ